MYADLNYFDTEENLTDEEKFHESRVAWAIINNQLYWIQNKLGHKEWLEKVFNIDKDEFENTIRGYIRLNKDESSLQYRIVDVMCYIGSDFREIDKLEDKIIRQLCCIVHMKYYYDEIRFYTGMEIGIPGEPWKPLRYMQTIKTDRPSNNINETSGEIVSLIELLQYEKSIVSLLNRGKIDAIIRRDLNDEWKNIVNYINNYDKQKLTTNNRIAYRAHNYSECW